MLPDVVSLTESGILTFESTLHQIIETLSSPVQKVRLPRIVSVAEQLKQDLETQAQALESKIQLFESSRTAEIEQLKEDANQIKQSFKASVANFENWLSLSNLLSRYQTEAVSALQKDSFHGWKTKDFKQVLTNHQDSIMKYIYQACDRLSHSYPSSLSITFPSDPSISRPSLPSTAEPTKKSVAVATGVGWVLAGPIGGAVAAGIVHVVNENTKKNNSSAWESYRSQLATVCSQGATDYLKRFSNQALEQLQEYTNNIEYIFTPSFPPESLQTESTRSQLGELLKEINNLDQCLQSFRYSLYEPTISSCDRNG